MEYYEIDYEKIMPALEAKKLLEGSAGLTLDVIPPSWGNEQIRQLAGISFVGNDGLTYKGWACRNREEGKSIDEGNNKVILDFVTHDIKFLIPLEDKVVKELGFVRRGIKYSDPNFIYVPETNSLVSKCSLN